MKRPTRKLVVRSETLRVLRALDELQLARVAGGADAALLAGTDRTQSGMDCPAQDLALALAKLP